MRLFYRGFSLLELLVTVLVAAIILSLGLPALDRSIARNRQRAELNSLFHALHLARKESIRRRELVSLCPSIDGRRCNPGRDWSRGWLLFENSDRDEPPRIDPDETVILARSSATGMRVTANRLGFTSRGIRRRATNGTLVVCDPEERIEPRALVVSYTGRPRIAARKTDGNPYTCAD